MRRREFIEFMCGAVTALPIDLRAAQASGSAHIGFISGLDQSAAADFLNALREIGEKFSLRIEMKKFQQLSKFFGKIVVGKTVNAKRQQYQQRALA